MHRKSLMSTIRQQSMKLFGENFYALPMAQEHQMESRVRSLLRLDSLRRERIGDRAMLATALSGVLLTMGFASLHLKFAAAEPAPSTPKLASAAVSSAIMASHFAVKLPSGIGIRLLGVERGQLPLSRKNTVWRAQGPWWFPDGTVAAKAGRQQTITFDPDVVVKGNEPFCRPVPGDSAYGLPYTPYRLWVEVQYPASQDQTDIALYNDSKAEAANRYNSASDTYFTQPWTKNGTAHYLATTYQNIPLGIGETATTVVVASGNWQDVMKASMDSTLGSDADLREERDRDLKAPANDLSRVYAGNGDGNVTRTLSGSRWFTLLLRSKQFEGYNNVVWRCFAVDRSGKKIHLEEETRRYTSPKDTRHQSDSYEFQIRLRNPDVKRAAYFVLQQCAETQIRFEHVALRPASTK